MSLREIVNVQITRQTTAVSRAGFGTIMVLGTHKKFIERIKYYTSMDEVSGDFDSLDLEYQAANAIFSQEPNPVQIAIGRRATGKATIIIQQSPNSVYSVNINGTIVTYTSGASDTALDIAAALTALINNASYPVTATDNEDESIDLIADVANAPFTLSLGQLIVLDSLENVSSFADDLDAIVEENDDWYGLVITSREKADQLACAQWIESRRKLFGISSADSDIVNVSESLDTDSIAYLVRNNNFARTFVLYHHLADQSAVLGRSYAEAAWMGLQFTTDPGSSTWNFKTLNGIATSDLSTTQSRNARDKKANVFVRVAEVAITREGTVAEGEFIDVIRGVDWLQARMTERIYFRLVNSPKIPYTNDGIAVIRAEIKAQLDQGILRGLIAADPEYTITTPDARTVAPNDKANRILPDVRFKAFLQGAIHVVNINGVVSI